jgi:glycosyltransferase involved in cell wall biosynthesis
MKGMTEATSSVAAVAARAQQGVASLISVEEIATLYPEAVRGFLRYAHFCHRLASELKAEAYIALGVEAIPAANVVAKTVGARLYCDVVDSPSFRDRGSSDDWHPADHALLDHAIEGYLRNADGISTVSWAWGNELQHYGPPVTVIPNYRPAEEVQSSDELREMCGIGPDDVLLLASSTIYSGFEPVIEALRLLPDDVHLATLGRIVKDCRDRVHAYPAEIGVENRVHFFDEVPFARLATLASGANLGLMAVNPLLRNHRLTLPHRVFDSIAAELPIVTPDTPDIARIVNERQIGVVVPSNEAYCWAEAIKTALTREQEMRPRVRQAAKELVWESLSDKIRAAYGYPASVTIIGYGDLVGHQRTLRMATTLAKGGARVTICCRHDAKQPVEEIPGVRFVFTPSPVSGNAAGPVQTRPVGERQSAALSTSEQELEELKKECLSLRERAARCDALEPELAALREKTAQYDDLAPELPTLRDRAARCDALEQELAALREKTAQYDDLALELPRLRDRAARYEVLAPDLRTLLACVAFTRQNGGAV